MCSDIEAIKALKYRYARSLDLKKWDEFADCLTPDVTAEYGEDLSFADRDALVGYMRDNMGPGLISMHQVHHPEIVVDGDTATGTWYLFDKVLVPAFDFGLEGGAFYDDTYLRTDAGWRISRTGYRRTFEAAWKLSDPASYEVKTGTAYDA